MKTPLRRKILFYSSALLIVLIVTMLVYVNYLADRFVNERIVSDIEQGRARIRQADEDRIRTLKLTAGLVASLPGLKAALSTDTGTVRDFLSYYQQQHTGTQLLIVLDTAGRVVARTDTPEAGPVPVDLDVGILTTDHGVYEFAKMPAEAGGAVFGYVIAGAFVDDNFARALQERSNSEVVIIGETILGSNLSRNTLSWQTRADWERAVNPDAPPRLLSVGNETYEAVATLLGGNGNRLLVVIMQSHDQAMAPYRRIQIGLLILGLIAAVVGVTISAVLARNVTSSVAKLVEGTQQVAAGNFDYRLDLNSTDEIGDLANSFNTMIRGLRERTDMQKFVSLSTVEMIHQSASNKKVSAGENVVLTIFFSDMRGFTAMTEHRTPAETVKLLNACLSLQADKVKKFHGDIDKFVADEVVAMFQGEDMELNAIRCAVEIHAAIDAFNASSPDVGSIHVGIGIVTGEVILGSIGSEDRLDYTIIGSNVNLCSRLCSKARPGETLLAESTYTRVRGLVAAEKIEPLQVKGFTDPIPVYRMGQSMPLPIASARL